MQNSEILLVALPCISMHASYRASAAAARVASVRRRVRVHTKMATLALPLLLPLLPGLVATHDPADGAAPAGVKAERDSCCWRRTWASASGAATAPGP
jgi:hypothetical protein